MLWCGICYKQEYIDVYFVCYIYYVYSYICYTLQTVIILYLYNKVLEVKAKLCYITCIFVY